MATRKKKPCLHENITIGEVIEGIHQRIFEGNDYYCNNEFGNKLYAFYHCAKCGLWEKLDTQNPPEWIAERVKILQDENLI